MVITFVALALFGTYSCTSMVPEKSSPIGHDHDDTRNGINDLTESEAVLQLIKLHDAESLLHAAQRTGGFLYGIVVSNDIRSFKGFFSPDVFLRFDPHGTYLYTSIMQTAESEELKDFLKDHNDPGLIVAFFEIDATNVEFSRLLDISGKMLADLAGEFAYKEVGF